MSGQGKKVVVFTATGDQGSSVIKYLQQEGYELVGLTRDPEGKGGQGINRYTGLKAKGVIPHKGDLADVSSYKSALEGAYAAFVNTDFWSIYGANGQDGGAAGKVETEQAKNAIQACVDAGVEHIIQSTLDGHIGVDHWDSKNRASEWALEKKYPVTPLYLTLFLEGLIKFKRLIPKDDGSFAIEWPVPDHAKIVGLPVSQTGLWVKAILANPDKYIGQNVYAVTSVRSITDMAKDLSEISGKRVRGGGIPDEVFKSEGFKKQVGAEMWDNFNLFYEGTLKRDVEASRAMVKGSFNFKEWAAQDPEVKQLLGF